MSEVAEADAVGEVTLAELTSLMSAVKSHADARYDVITEQLTDLITRMDDLGGADDKEPPDGGQAESTPDEDAYRSWSARATGQDWAELIAWVDWMQEHYSLAGHALDPVPPCWPAHRGVVEQFAALRSSWRAAMADDVDGDGASDAALYWHDRWLWPTREWASASFLERCRVGRHENAAAPPRTNPEYVPGIRTAPGASERR
ncbi:MAG: hypothetical protein ACRDMV_03635 [Streptosporangiales bacterium]